LFASFRKVLTSEIPTAAAFLELGQQICNARLYYIAHDALPKQSLPQSYAANLIHAATRYHEIENDEQTRARVRDDLHVATLLDDIRANGRWGHVRDELANCATIIVEADRKRQEQLKTLLTPASHIAYRPTVNDGRWWADATVRGSDNCPTCGNHLTGNDRIGWTCSHCQVMAEPNPIRQAEAELVEWSRIAVVRGKFCNGWRNHLERCRQAGMPEGEPNSWLDVIEDAWTKVQPGKPLVNANLAKYIYAKRKLSPDQVGALTLQELAVELSDHAEELALSNPSQEEVVKDVTREYLIKVGTLKSMLNQRARGEQVPEKEYVKLRSELLAFDAIRDALPTFVLTCYTPQDFWLFIKPKFATWSERTEFLRQEFAPILSWLEGTTPAPKQPPRATPPPQPDLVVVTVNQHETQAVFDAFYAATNTEAVPMSIDGRVYHDLDTINGTRVFHALSEMGSGSVGAMQQTVDKAIRALKPAAVFAVGIAFGADRKKQEIGDILVSKQLRPYDLQRAGEKIILRDDKPHSTPRLINHFELFTQTRKWTGAKVWPGVSTRPVIDGLA
jgi:hypothetical protein